MTVPAYFNDPMRAATRNAAELAGIELLGLLSEPTAAALAFGYEHRPAGATGVVVDLGGGTFDVTVMDYDGSNLAVRATGGDYYLGGANFDKVLFDYFVEHFAAAHGLDINDPDALSIEECTQISHDWLLLTAQARRWGALVPDEDQALGAKAKELRNEVARALDSLRQECDQRVRAGEVVHETAEGITQAKQRLLGWAEAGFGLGDVGQWFAVIEPSMVADPGETRDDQFAVVRQKIREEFSRVDGSMATAVGRLQYAVAARLRQHLGETLVPAGEQPLQALVHTTQQQRLETLRSAIQELVEFRTYGNIFLRVGRPIVNSISATQVRPPVAAAEAFTEFTADVAADLSGPSAAAGRRQARGGSWKESVKTIGRAAGGGPAVDAAFVAAEVATAAMPVVTGIIGNGPPADNSAAGLHASLTDAFRRAVDEIEQRMQAEARGLTEVLASVMDQFFDRFAHTPGVEAEFERLCAPVRRELWRDIFDGRSAELAEAFDQVTKVAAGTDEAGRRIRAVAAGFGVR